MLANAKFNVWKKDEPEQLYSSNDLYFETGKADLEVKQTINQNEFQYGDAFEIKVTVTNHSKAQEAVNVTSKVPKYMNITGTKLICNGVENQLYSFNDVKVYKEMKKNETIEIILTGKVTMTYEIEDDYEFLSIFTATAKSGAQKQSNPQNIAIHGSKAASGQAKKEENYSISGNVYSDISGNIKSQVAVQLMKSSTMVQATTSDSYGNYSFKDLKPGDYSVVYTYDENSYSVPATADIVEVKEGVAVTDTIHLENASLNHVDAGLVEKDKFDFKIDQYLVSSAVSGNGKEAIYDYDKSELSKIEIEPGDLEGTTVKLTYRIVVTNVGTVTGQVSSIVDYVPNGMTFYQAENADWTTGVIAGNVYYNGLSGVDIAPRESKEITLVLTKAMNENNTGVVSNKVRIAYAESATRLTEMTQNNFATQETIITLTQGAGHKVMVVITISMLVIVTIFAYMVVTGKMEISFHLKDGLKKVYK